MKKITRKNLDKFLARHASTERVLDIGSGGSEYDRFFPNRFSIDVDPARKPDLVADAHDLPFKDGEFKMIVCTEVLEHVKDPFQVEREMWRVLAPGGTLVLTTRFVYPLHDTPHDYWRFTKYGLQRLFGRWRMVELFAETHSFSTIAALLQRIDYQSKLRGGIITRTLLMGFVVLFDALNGLVRSEYGDRNQRSPETDIMPAGYGIVCRKEAS